MKRLILMRPWKPKIRNGGTHYDVAFPSEYTVQKLKRENLLEPLDHSKIQI